MYSKAKHQLQPSTCYLFSSCHRPSPLSLTNFFVLQYLNHHVHYISIRMHDIKSKTETVLSLKISDEQQYG